MSILKAQLKPSPLTAPPPEKQTKTKLYFLVLGPELEGLGLLSGLRKLSLNYILPPTKNKHPTANVLLPEMIIYSYSLLFLLISNSGLKPCFIFFFYILFLSYLRLSRTLKSSVVDCP